jgi:hypothetical protein
MNNTIVKAINTNNIYNGSAVINYFPNGSHQKYYDSLIPGNNLSGLYSNRFFSDDTIYGEVYLINGTGIQLIPSGNIYNKVTGFTHNGFYQHCIPDYTNNSLTVIKPGIYRMNFSFSTYTDTNNCELHTCAFINDQEVMSDLHTMRRIINANQSSVSSVAGFISVTGYSTIDIRTKHDTNGSVNITPIYGNFNVVYIGSLYE